MTAMRDRVRVGQHWRRRRDGFEIRLRQVHRADHLAEAVPITLRLDGRITSVSFQQLRDDYVEVHRAA
jgi:hypothetical protein